MQHSVRRALAGLLLLLLIPAPGSAQWMGRNAGTANLLEAVWFTGVLNGWIVGDAGTTRFTTDGGATWTPELLTAGDVADIAFRGPVGLAVADNGQIFRTTGAGWTLVPSGTTENLMNVAFGGPGLAYASGRGGVILRSADDGASWSLVETGANRYRGLAAQGQNAWTTGDGPVIRATTDAGVTWFDQTSGAPDDLRGVHFLSETEGWVAGSSSTVIYTNDGGATWSPRVTGLSGDLNDVFFVSPMRGWVVGDAGAVFATGNGGLNWLSEGSETLANLNGLFFLGESWGWAVGDGGTVIVRDGVTSADELASGIVVDGVGAAPNPFASATEIRYSLPGAVSRVSVRVLDVAGRLVRTLATGPHGAGAHAVNWDGRDALGRPTPGGVYFYHVQWNGGSRTGRLVHLR